MLQSYLPDLYNALGVFLSLLTVNCIILGRAEMFARKNNVAASALAGLGMGPVSYTHLSRLLRIQLKCFAGLSSIMNSIIMLS